MPLDEIHTIKTKEEFTNRINELAQSLSQAFYDDPYYKYIMPNNGRRLKQLLWWMKLMLRYSFLCGYVQCSSDNKAAALWVGPNRPFISDLKMLSLGIALFPFKVGLKSFIRLIRISDSWSREHKKQNKRHYYLLVLGVSPDSQKGGLGGRLLNSWLKRANDENLGCYLETVTEGGARFYERNGFKTILTGDFNTNDHFWIMTRSKQ
ncbi:GNAT family N-acetyltransferase [Reichenbachiella versicolor]|uniref:GNAT family N-acetyltransferase n=1 Tax=Reichenbachiella versicolor TaxID=1821036 RepID=UPI0013A5B763|nr:GNAT family N-acetyltransferase [Reichenbachiella versicolor]